MEDERAAARREEEETAAVSGAQMIYVMIDSFNETRFDSVLNPIVSSRDRVRRRRAAAGAARSVI